MNRRNRIERQLSVLKPQYLKIIDQSDMHEGHIENLGGTETHLKIVISSTILDKMSSIDKHRTINKLLADEFDSGLHALSLNIKKSSESNTD